MLRRARLATALALLAAPAALAAQAKPAAQPAGPRAPFSALGRYELTLIDNQGGGAVSFGVTVVDSAGVLVGEFIGGSGRKRPLLGVVAHPDSSSVDVHYEDGSGLAKMTLRFRGDSVAGAAVYDDGSFPVRGVRRPLAP